MVSILINIIQHVQYFFSFQAHISAVCLFLSKSCHILLSLIPHHRVNNKCNRAKGWCWRQLIYVLHDFFYVTIHYMFSEATTTVLESFTNSTGKQLCRSLFFKNLQACRPISNLFSLYLIIHFNYVKSNCLYK